MTEIEYIHNCYVNNELLFGEFTILHFTYLNNGIYVNDIQVEDKNGRFEYFELNDFIEKYKVQFRRIKIEKIRIRLNKNI